MRTGFVVVTDRGRFAFAQCLQCKCALIAESGETIDEVLELHAEWHDVMRETAEQVREELREHGFEI